MNSKRSRALNWRIYCILDRNALKGKFPAVIAKRLYSNGVDVIQLRFSNYPSYKLVPLAKRITVIAKKMKKTLLINNSVETAMACRAHGVHLGKGDFTLTRARKILGQRAIIGRTLHTLQEAAGLRSNEIDYVSAGPVFGSPIKRMLGKKGVQFIKKIKNRVSLPVYAIGGINSTNASSVIKVCDGVCIMRALSEIHKLKETVESCNDVD